MNLDDGLMGPDSSDSAGIGFDERLAERVTESLSAVDLSRFVEQAVAREVAKTTGKFVAAAMEEALTPERVEALELQAAEHVERALTGGDQVDEEEEAPPEPHFPNVFVFVRDFLAPMYARYGLREQSPWRWCDHWWEHLEAFSRLEALWQAFEALRLTPGTGPAVWWRDYADPTMATLADPSGPFQKCGGGKHELPATLPLKEPPPALLEENAPAAAALTNATPE